MDNWDQNSRQKRRIGERDNPLNTGGHRGKGVMILNVGSQHVGDGFGLFIDGELMEIMVD